MKKTLPLKKNNSQKCEIIQTSLADYPTVQNMARFYVYDLSRECGLLSGNWILPANGLYESFDLKNYFLEPTRKAFLVKVAGELAGFVLLNQAGTISETHWNIGEFFILAKFQKQGIGTEIARQIWETHPNIWEVSVHPDNKSAISFWSKVINAYTGGNYQQETKLVSYDKNQPQRIIFSFDSCNINHA